MFHGKAEGPKTIVGCRIEDPGAGGARPPPDGCWVCSDIRHRSQGGRVVDGAFEQSMRPCVANFGIVFLDRSMVGVREVRRF